MEQYLLCLMFHLAFPLLPIGAEYVITRRISTSTLHLVASTYAMSIGVSSKSALGFGVGMFIAVVFAALYGIAVGGTTMPQSAIMVRGAALPTWAIVFVFIIHALERFNRHVVDRAPFWEFTKRVDE